MDPAGPAAAALLRTPRRESSARVGVLLIGDIVGDAGMRAVFAGLRGLLQRRTGRRGSRRQWGKRRRRLRTDPGSRGPASSVFGVQVITSGNHVWQHPVLHHTLEQEQRLLRPENYLPECTRDTDACVVRTPGADVGVLNVQGPSCAPVTALSVPDGGQRRRCAAHQDTRDRGRHARRVLGGKGSAGAPSGWPRVGRDRHAHARDHRRRTYSPRAAPPTSPMSA